VTLLYMKNLEQNLDNRFFIRVHKSYIVSVNRVEGIEGNEIFIQSHKIPVSRNHREQVLKQIVSKNLWVK
jgi:DNA-binding LytR/AlgR family response regulator